MVILFSRIQRPFPDFAVDCGVGFGDYLRSQVGPGHGEQFIDLFFWHLNSFQHDT
jgi:hypothetical protein